MKRHLVAVDIGGSKTAILVVEANTHRKVYSEKLKTPADSGVGADAFGQCGEQSREQRVARRIESESGCARRQ